MATLLTICMQLTRAHSMGGATDRVALDLTLRVGVCVTPHVWGRICVDEGDEVSYVTD